jgi:hypothetical protein
MLWLGSTAFSPADPIEHRVRIDHVAGPVDAQYRAQVEINHRQIGNLTPPGVPTTLRCAWRVDMQVQREVRHHSGALLHAELRRDGIARGSRLGWCTGQQNSIAQHAARQTDPMRSALMEVVRQDQSTLMALLDQIPSPAGK